MMSVRELPASQTALAHPAIARLRPEHADRERFVDRVNHVLRPEGYRLVAAFLDDRPDPDAVVGFRHLRSLAWGDHLQLEDLALMPWAAERPQLAGLHDWLAAEAARCGCTQIHLERPAQELALGADHGDLDFGFGLASYCFTRPCGH